MLLIFSDPDCGDCNELLPQVAGWGIADRVTVAVVSQGTAEKQEEGAKQFENLLLQTDRLEVSEAYGVRGTPTLVVVQNGKIIAFAAGIEAIIKWALEQEIGVAA